jgi:lysophospholipid acyltransferase (LPLAT)-like uncharacterized protein
MTPTAAPNNPSDKRRNQKPFQRGNVHTVTGWRYNCVFLPIAFVLRIYLATLRLVPASKADADNLRFSKHSVILTIWHNRSFILPEIIRRFRSHAKTAALISPSRQAAWEVCFYRMFSIDNIRGSSTRRSIHAVRELMHSVKAGTDMIISPDGPIGPVYELKKGALFVSYHTHAPLLFISADGPAWRPKTWDRHFIPLPFSKINIRCQLIEPTHISNGLITKEHIQQIRDQLMQSTHDTCHVR